jgi:hypothetical protein
MGGGAKVGLAPAKAHRPVADVRRSEKGIALMPSEYLQFREPLYTAKWCMLRWGENSRGQTLPKRVSFQKKVREMSSVSGATVLIGSASDDSDSPLAFEFGQKEPLPDGKTQKLLDRLEVENTKLRARVIELVLEIRALCDREVEWRDCA